jgi:hypothetical protein
MARREIDDSEEQRVPKLDACPAHGAPNGLQRQTRRAAGFLEGPFSLNLIAKFLQWGV